MIELLISHSTARKLFKFLARRSMFSAQTAAKSRLPWLCRTEVRFSEQLMGRRRGGPGAGAFIRVAARFMQFFRDLFFKKQAQSHQKSNSLESSQRRKRGRPDSKVMEGGASKFPRQASIPSARALFQKDGTKIQHSSLNTGTTDHSDAARGEEFLTASKSCFGPDQPRHEEWVPIPKSYLRPDQLRATENETRRGAAMKSLGILRRNASAGTSASTISTHQNYSNPLHDPSNPYHDPLSKMMFPSQRIPMQTRHDTATHVHDGVEWARQVQQKEEQALKNRIKDEQDEQARSEADLGRKIAELAFPPFALLLSPCFQSSSLPLHHYPQII
jgi:hypothetical protein